jgi:hypothetical protein
MSETSSKEKAAARRAPAGVPPWPPREPTDGGDDSHCLAVLFFEHRESGDEAERNHRLAAVKFDPRRSRQTHETLSPRYTPSLFATISYFADTGAVVIMVLREKHDLVTLESPGPSDTYVTVRLSHETTLSILVHRKFKV